MGADWLGGLDAGLEKYVGSKTAHATAWKNKSEIQNLKSHQATILLNYC